MADRSCEAVQGRQHGAQARLVDAAAKANARAADLDLDDAGVGARRWRRCRRRGRCRGDLRRRRFDRDGQQTGVEIAVAIPRATTRRCSRRHLNSRLALIPLSSAMPDTDAPGCRLRSINSRLSAGLCSRRRRLACVSCSDMVCTKSLVHTIPGTHDHAILLGLAAPRQRVLRPRLQLLSRARRSRAPVGWGHFDDSCAPHDRRVDDNSSHSDHPPP